MPDHINRKEGTADFYCQNTIERYLGDQGVMTESYFNSNLFIVPEECWQSWHYPRRCDE